MSEKRATHGATTACRDGSGWWLRTTGDGWLQKCAVLLALLCAGLAAAPALAQIESATLRGNVAGQDAAPSAGVAVVARDVDRGYTSTTTTRADGSYIFVGLKPGTYEISVGGRTEEVTLRVGQIASLDFGGGAGTEAVEEIVVTGTKVASFTGGEVGTNITPEMMERLPQTDRNFLAFADLAPGVQVDRGTGGQVHIRGGAQNINKINVFLDGVSQKDYVLRGGITGQDTSRGNPFPQAAVGEYKVITQNYKAEYQHVGSAAITAVTKSGTNEFHGDVFYDFTDEGLRETEPSEVEAGKTPSSTEQYGATFSGPIIRDKLHFLVSYEEKAFETPLDVVGGNGIGNVPLPAEYEELLGTFPGEFDEELLFGKVDWWINDNQSLEASMKLRDEVGYDFGGARTVSNASTGQVEEERFALKHTLTGARFQNEIRFATEDVGWAQQPANFESATILEDADRQRILNIGGNAGYQTKGQKGWSLQNDFTWLDLEWNGSHVIKAGIQYRDIDLEILQQHNTNPQYFYNVEINGAGTFNVVQPNRVAWFVPASGSDVGGAFVSDVKQYGFYLQDDWDVTDRLTLNIGVRWDYEDIPTYTDYVTPANLVETLENWDNIQDTDYDFRDYVSTGNNRDNFDSAWAPRLGFSYVLDDDAAHTLFGGYGRSYDRNQFDLLKNEVLRGTFATAQFNFTGDPDNPCDPMAADNCVAWDPVYLTEEGRDSLVTDVEVLDEAHLLPNDLKVPYADQFSIGVRSTWGDYWSTEVSLSYVESHDQFSWYLGNRREGGAFFEDGTIWGPPFGFGLPDRGRSLIVGRNDGYTETDSVYVKVGRAHVENWGFSLAYTWTDATENRPASGQFNLNYPTVDGYTGYTVIDIPEHSLVATGTYDLPWDIQATAKYTYRSPLPKQFINESNGDGQYFFDRIEPDDGDYSSFDLSLIKSFTTPFLMDESEVWVRADVINLFNNSNYRNFLLGFNDEDFGEPNPNSSTYGRRSMKLSAGWRF